MSQSPYGKFYWGIELTSGKVLLMCADEVRIQDGTLCFFRIEGQLKILNCAYAPGVWKTVYNANEEGDAAMVEVTGHLTPVPHKP